MKKRLKNTRNSSWIPFVDTRIFPDIFTFSCVKGPERVFLQIEMILALLVVIGTCIVIIFAYS